MALEPDELWDAGETVKPNLRAFPYEGGLLRGQLSAITGAPTLPHLTPMAYDTGNSVWNVWDNATAAIDEIGAFLWAPGEEDVVASASGEKLVQLLVRGQVHADDVPLPTTASQTQNALDAALVDPAVRQRGLDVRGIDGVH